MPFYTDLHIHSRYSRATSKDMTPENIWKWAQIKGISVVGTGDFTHPAWLRELNDKLEPLGNGLLRLKKEFETDGVPDACISDVFFMPSTEISSIYKKNGKTRKIHSLILAPGLDDAKNIQSALSKIGNIESDGRPILGLDAKTLLKIVMDICPDAAVIPAHAWTPHFSVFGAVSGFDSLDECYEELTPHIFAIETGLSSDPSMNWRLSALDNTALISNSDAHSPSKLGREANILDTELSYKAITNGIKTKKGLLGTIEFFPEEGKYHNDGHRACGVNLAPDDSKRHNNVCPVCGRKLTIGVLHRVERLADRQKGATPDGALPFLSLIPLTEIIGDCLKVGANSKTVTDTYRQLVSSLGSELRILVASPVSDLETAGGHIISDAVSNVRLKNVQITPGFDGQYGKIKILH